MFARNTQFEHVSFRNCRGSVLPLLDNIRFGDRLSHTPCKSIKFNENVWKEIYCGTCFPFIRKKVGQEGPTGGSVSFPHPLLPSNQIHRQMLTCTDFLWSDTEANLQALRQTLTAHHTAWGCHSECLFEYYFEHSSSQKLFFTSERIGQQFCFLL
jgi:hypothetical protein